MNMGFPEYESLGLDGLGLADLVKRKEITPSSWSTPASVPLTGPWVRTVVLRG